MAYKIGQYRYNSNNIYYETTSSNNISLTRYIVNSVPQIYEYDNFDFEYYGEINNTLSNTKNYYLQFTIPAPPANTTAHCIIMLINTVTEQQEVIDSILLTNNSTTFSYAIIPKFAGKIRLWLSYNSALSISYNLYEIKNLSTITNQKTIKKIGVQGAPHLPVWINNNCIRLNKNGIYELHNGI